MTRYPALPLAALISVAVACTDRPTIGNLTTGGSSSGSSAAVTGGSTSSSSVGVSSGNGSSASGTSSTGNPGGSATGAGASTTTGGGGDSTAGGSSGGAVACGAGLAWFGEVCAAVSCQGQPIAWPCPLADGGVGGCYGGACLSPDFESDPQNCGGFGLACPPNGHCEQFQCASGLCTGLDAGCSAGAACAGEGTCVLTACGLGQDERACSLDGGLVGGCCGGACLDLQSAADPDNCGGCGVVCSGSQVCLFDGTLGSPGPACVTVTTCGASNNGSSCQLPAANAVGVCCQGSCVELMDPGFAACVVSACTAGTDGAQCTGSVGSPDTGMTCCGGSCVDLGTDPANCGGCGIACPAGAACVPPSTAPASIGAGHCVFEACPGGCDDAGSFIPQECAPGEAGGCPDGFSCSNGGCLPTTCGSVEGSQCAFSVDTEGICCGGQCRDELSDSTNCMACGNVCPTGSACLGLASLGCFDTKPSDACLATCGPSSVCSGNQCVSADACNFVASEGDSYAPCAASDGTVGVCCGFSCAHPLDDPDNCGACGIVCPAGQGCSGGVCG